MLGIGSDAIRVVEIGDVFNIVVVVERVCQQDESADVERSLFGVLRSSRETHLQIIQRDRERKEKRRAAAEFSSRAKKNSIVSSPSPERKKTTFERTETTAFRRTTMIHLHCEKKNFYEYNNEQ